MLQRAQLQQVVRQEVRHLGVHRLLVEQHHLEFLRGVPHPALLLQDHVLLRLAHLHVDHLLVVHLLLERHLELPRVVYPGGLHQALPHLERQPLPEMTPQEDRLVHRRHEVLQLAHPAPDRPLVPLQEVFRERDHPELLLQALYHRAAHLLVLQEVSILLFSYFCDCIF
jgi:hypothetical protein